MTSPDVQQLDDGGYDLLCQAILISPDDRYDIKFKIQACDIVPSDRFFREQEDQNNYHQYIPRSIFKKSKSTLPTLQYTLIVQKVLSCFIC